MEKNQIVLRVYQLFYLTLFFFFLTDVAFSQGARDNVKNEYVREIVVEESGIHAISRNPSDTIVIDLNNNTVLYCYPDSAVSFWYKIYAKKDCEISFDIYPANADNTYNYFLYKNRGNFNISDVNKYNIYPIRANLFKDEMAEIGTGLSRSAKVDYSDTCSKTRSNQFYHTAYHNAVPANYTVTFQLWLNNLSPVIDSCYFTDNYMVNLNPTANAVMDIRANNITIFPNPVAQGQSITIQSDEMFDVKTYTIYNLVGATITSGIIQHNQLPLNGIPQGLYVLNITDNSLKNTNFKLIIE